MLATVFKRLFTRTKHASKNIVTKQYINFETKTYIFANNFIKCMNVVNPQETGRIIEYVLSNLFIKQSKNVNFVPLDGINVDMINIITKNLYEYKFFVKQMNDFILCLIGWKSNKTVPVYLQDNLSFKKASCCKVKELKCFADVTTHDTIIELKVVRSSFFCLNSINTEVVEKKLNNVGLRYYNQLMTYACGFNNKYKRWPRRLILLNAYTGEVIDWHPTITSYDEFYDLI